MSKDYDCLFILVCVNSVIAVNTINEELGRSTATSPVRKFSEGKKSVTAEKPNIALSGYDESKKAGFVFTNNSFAVLTAEPYGEANGYKLVYSYTLNIAADGYLIESPSLDKVNSFIYINTVGSKVYSADNGCAVVAERINFEEASTSCQAFQNLAQSLETKLPLPQKITVVVEQNSKTWNIIFSGSTVDYEEYLSEDGIARYLIKKMELKTFEVDESKQIGVTYFGYGNVRDHIDVIINKALYSSDMSYENNKYIVTQSTSNVEIVGHGNYSSYGKGYAVAVEKSGGMVFMIGSNNWNQIFHYEDVIRFYDASGVEEFKEVYNKTYDMVATVFDGKFELLTTASEEKQEKKRRNIASNTEASKFLYSEVNELNGYTGYFNMGKTFIMIIQKNTTVEASQENVYKLQLVVDVNDKSKSFKLTRESLVNKTSGVELPKSKAEEFNCSTSFISLEDITSVCNESVNYVESLIKEYINYAFLFGDNKNISVEDSKGEKSVVIFKESSFSESLGFEGYITKTVTKNTIRIKDAFVYNDDKTKLDIFHIKGAFIINTKANYGDEKIYEVVKPTESTTSYVKMGNYYYFGKEESGNSIVVYRSERMPFFDTKYFEGKSYEKMSDEKVYSLFKRERDYIYSKVIELCNEFPEVITTTPSTNPSTDPTVKPTSDSTINSLFEDRGLLFQSFDKYGYYLLNDSYVIVSKVWDDSFFKVEYQYQYNFTVYGYGREIFFESFSLNKDKSWFYYSDKNINEFNNSGCVLIKNEYTYNEVSNLCDSVKSDVEEIIKNLKLPIQLSSEQLLFDRGFYMHGKWHKYEDLKYIVNNYHYDTYPVEGSILYSLTSSDNGVELNTPYFRSFLKLNTYSESYSFSYSTKYSNFVVLQNGTKIIPQGRTYVKLNPNDDVYVIASGNDYDYGNYYSKVIRAIKKDEILDLFENEYKNNISGKLPEYLNKTFERRLNMDPVYFAEKKQRNLEISDEKYSEMIHFNSEDNFLKYIGVFYNKQQLILIIREESEVYNDQTLYQIKYVIDNYKNNEPITITTSSINRKLSGVELSILQSKKYNCPRSYISFEDLQKKCSGAYTEITNMINRNATALRFGIRYGSEYITFSSRGLAITYELYVSMNNYYKSIFTDVIPRITINIIPIPADKSFSIPSLVYKTGDKICEICETDPYEIKCNKYSTSGSPFYTKGSCFSSYRYYYTTPGSNVYYYFEGGNFPIRKYIDNDYKEIVSQYSNEKDVREALTLYDSIKMSDLYGRIRKGIREEKSEIVHSFNRTCPGNYLVLATSTECGLIYKEYTDDRLVKIVYKYKLNGDKYSGTFHDVELDETKTMFYFTENQLREEKITECVETNREYKYSELKNLECIKPTIDKYLREYGKPVYFESSSYIYFEYDYSSCSYYYQQSESELRYLIENIRSKTYPVPVKNLQGMIDDGYGINVFTPKSWYSFSARIYEFTVQSTESNIKIKDNSTIVSGGYEGEDVMIFYCLSEKCDKIYYYETGYKESVYDMYLNSRVTDGDFSFAMKLEKEVKSIFNSYKAKLDIAVEKNQDKIYDSDENNNEKRELSLRSIQASGKAYYYEHSDPGEFNFLEYGLSKEGYYSGFFITQNKFVFINHTSYEDQHNREDKNLYGIKLVTNVNTQKLNGFSFSDSNIVKTESVIELSAEVNSRLYCKSSLISLDQLENEGVDCKTYLKAEISRLQKVKFTVANNKLTVLSDKINLKDVSLKEIDSTTLTNTLKTISVNQEKLPSDKSLYEDYKEKNDVYSIESHDIKINNTFFEILYGDIYVMKMKGFTIKFRDGIESYRPLQLYTTKSNPNKYYTSNNYPIYRKFFDLDGAKDYINDRNMLIDKYANLFNSYSKVFVDMMVSEIDGIVIPTIDPTKQPQRVDYLLRFCDPINMISSIKGVADDNLVANKINDFVSDYLINNGLFFFNLTVEKVKDDSMSFNISYKVNPDSVSNATRLNEKIDKEYDLFDSIFSLSNSVYDSCNPPYTECSYSLPYYVFKVNNESNAKPFAISPKGDVTGVSFVTRCNNNAIVDADSGSFQIPNRILSLSVCRITCISERRTSRSTSFTVSVKETVDYKPSIDVSRISIPTMVYANQQFRIRIPVTCPSLENDEGINTTLSDVKMNLEWNIENGEKYKIASDSILSDEQKVSESCDQTFTFVLNFTTDEAESSMEMLYKMKINITSDNYDMKYSFDISLVRQKCSNPDAVGVCCKHEEGELCETITTTFPFLILEGKENPDKFKDNFLKVLDRVLFNNSHFWYTDISDPTQNPNTDSNEPIPIDVKLIVKTNTIKTNVIHNNEGRLLQELEFLDVNAYFAEFTETIDSMNNNDNPEIQAFLNETGTIIDPDKKIGSEPNVFNPSDIAPDIDPNASKENDNKSWTEKYWYVILIIALVVVVLLVVIGVVTYRAADKTKVKRIEKKQLEICEKVIPIEKVKEKQGVKEEEDIYHPYNETVIMEGYLMKEGKHGYQRRYCVLYYNPNEMKLYESMTPSYYGNVYVGEKQAYKMESLKEVKYKEGSNTFNAIFSVNDSAIKHYDKGENIRNIHFKMCESVNEKENGNEKERAKRWAEAFESYISGKPNVKPAWLVPVALVRDENQDGKLVAENSVVAKNRMMDNVAKARANRKVVHHKKKEVLRDN